MKTVFALSMVACLGLFLAKGQEAPPAFERADGEAPEETEEGYDPFDPMFDAPRMVRVQFEHIEVSHKDLTRLMMEDTSVVSNAKPLRMKVQDLVEKDAAKVFETQILVCRSGQKCTTESIYEFMYPTEYELPEAPKPPPSEKEKDNALPPSESSNPPTPIVFETKNIGTTMEIEPTISENDLLIDLRFLPELTWHTGETVWSEIKDKQGNVNKVAMPKFYKLSINTSITCVAGQYVMVGALSPKTEKGEVDRERKIMVFVKCDILSAAQ